MAIGFKGTSISDIEQGAEDALEEDIANMSPASNSVAANLDGGVAAVDWSSKTSQFDEITGSTLSVTGSGYLIGLSSDPNGGYYVEVDIDIDGTTLGNKLLHGGTSDSPHDVSLFHRFDTSLSVTETRDNGREAKIAYVLD